MSSKPWYVIKGCTLFASNDCQLEYSHAIVEASFWLATFFTHENKLLVYYVKLTIIEVNFTGNVQKNLFVYSSQSTVYYLSVTESFTHLIKSNPKW